MDRPDLDALAVAAEALATADTGPVSVDTLVAELTRRGVTVRVLDAGPDSDGAVTQLLADPAAWDVARWAAQRRLTPTSLYGISLGLGLIAAIWFSELAVRATLLAVVALVGSFLASRRLAARRYQPHRYQPHQPRRPDRGSGQFAPATTPLTSWALICSLGVTAGLLTELGLYAALAVARKSPCPSRT